MARRVVLIRAVNVGKAKLPMSDLRDIAAELGATDIETYIASGNLVCTVAGKAADFDRALEAAIQDRFGYFREVISRTPAQLQAALDAHPFEVDEPKYSYLYPLACKPNSKSVKDFHGKSFGDDQFEVIGDTLHIRYRDGAGRSDLTAAAIAKGLGVQGTGRNLLTVRKLIVMAT